MMPALTFYIERGCKAKEPADDIAKAFEDDQEQIDTIIAGTTPDTGIFIPGFAGQAASIPDAGYTSSTTTDFQSLSANWS